MPRNEKRETRNEKRETRNGNEWKLDRIKPNGEKKTAWGLSGSFFWGGFLWASLFLPCVHLRMYPSTYPYLYTISSMYCTYGWKRSYGSYGSYGSIKVPR